MRTSTTCALCALLVAPGLAWAQSDPGSDVRETIRSARSAAPRSVTEDATIIDGTMPPTDPDREPTVLREGSNGWTCMPDNPDVPGDSPACVDGTWRDFLDAFLRGDEAPRYDGVGVSYMLRGDFPVSNRDPFASGPTADNEWIRDSGPHVMLLVSDRNLLEGLPTSPGDGPWVMWAGTPYAHVMIPVPGTPRH